MNSKIKLLAVGVLLGVVALATATGAFTTVEAERTATVDVTGDANALLGLEEADDIGTGAVSQENGQIVIDLSESGLSSSEATAEGLNPDANTTITPLLNVTNNGANDVDLETSIAENADGIENVEVVDSDGDSFDGEQLDSGETVQIGLKVETNSELSDSEAFDLVITLEADEVEE